MTNPDDDPLQGEIIPADVPLPAGWDDQPTDFFSSFGKRLELYAVLRVFEAKKRVATSAGDLLSTQRKNLELWEGYQKQLVRLQEHNLEKILQGVARDVNAELFEAKARETNAKADFLEAKNRLTRLKKEAGRIDDEEGVKKLQAKRGLKELRDFLDQKPPPPENLTKEQARLEEEFAMFWRWHKAECAKHGVENAADLPDKVQNGLNEDFERLTKATEQLDRKLKAEGSS